jgi:hypothetical protein
MMGRVTPAYGRGCIWMVVFKYSLVNAAQVAFAVITLFDQRGLYGTNTSASLAPALGKDALLMESDGSITPVA